MHHAVRKRRRLVHSPDNAERQREFRAQNPGYRNKFRSKYKPANLTSEAILRAAGVTTPQAPAAEPTLFDPLPPYEPQQAEKPIDLALAGLAM